MKNKNKYSRKGCTSLHSNYVSNYLDVIVEITFSSEISATVLMT